MEATRGKITIVPTPIGNMGDITARGEEALRACDAVCAEDTRVTGSLLAALGISKRLERLDENRMGQRADDVVARAAAGERIAYCSDAGMPGVSDPGLRLVAAAREADVPVEVLPGPSAADTAYVASGTTCPRFYFGGFFPRKATERERLLGSLRPLDAALIFYESPNRLASALGAMEAAYPHREAAVCRELTKLHEEVVRGSLAELRSLFEGRGSVKGEVVIVIDAPSERERAHQADASAVQAESLAADLASQGLRAKDVAKRIAAECGIPRNAAYEMALAAADARDGAGRA